MSFKRVVVLMGGFSAEREVSLSSGAACASALENLGYDVIRLDVDRDVAVKLKQLAPDAVFNALHGPFGEDGRIQGLLEYLNLPYTHSGVLASALAMNKAKAKTIVQANGVSVASSVVRQRFSITNEHLMPVPYVIKPLNEGSSFGVYIIDKDSIKPPLEHLQSSNWTYGDEVLIEQYIPGREFTCAILGDEILGVLEIIPHQNHKFYNFSAKYENNGSIHIIPEKLSPIIYQNIQIMTRLAHQALGCRGVSRSDFRFDEATNTLVWLEINTQPGMTPSSLVPDIARNSGTSFSELVTWILGDASCMR